MCTLPEGAPEANLGQGDRCHGEESAIGADP